MLVATAPLGANATEGRVTYLVMPKEGSSQEVRGAISALGEYPEDQFVLVDDLIIVDLLPEDASRLAANPLIEFIEQDAPVSITDTQTPTPSWGLDRIDGIFDNSFTYPDSAGEGVRAYVFDTGVAGDHPDLIGRVTNGFDVIGSNQANTDCHSHGTHVAGTIAGKNYGLAKNATVVPLRVLNCAGSGSITGVIRAANWVMANHPTGFPAVANLSLGGGRNLSLNAAMAALVDRGITTVVAAGNSAADACNYSPASTPQAITVGATDRFDNRASFSNFGECVDLFAPGSAISSANSKNYAQPISYSGTSMASPHVAGVAALILGANPAASTEQVEAILYGLSQAGVVKNSRTDRGNRLAVSPPQSFAPIPQLSPGPSGLEVSGAGVGFVEFQWSAVQGASGYEVEFRKDSQNNFSESTVSSTSFRVTGLDGGESAFLRVRAVFDSGTTRYSAVVTGKSALIAPSAPRDVSIAAVGINAANLTWRIPGSLGGATSVQYKVEMKTSGDWQSIQTGPQTSLSISDLRVVHKFRVLAFNTAGSSDYSNEISFDPSMVFGVSNLEANVVGRSVDVRWDSDAPSDTSFEIRLVQSSNGQLIRLVTVATREVRLEGLLRMTSYNLTVTPLGQIRGLSAFSSFETSAVSPEPPRVLSGNKVPAGFLLRFAAPADNGGALISGYRLEKLLAGNWTGVQSSMVTEFTVPEPLRGQTDEYRLIAINSSGESLPSSVLRVSTPAAAASEPTNLASQMLSDGRVSLSWSAPVDDGGSPITSYRIEILRDAAWVLYASTSSTSITLPVLAKGAELTYRVIAVNRAGLSQPSSVVTQSRDKTVPGNVTSFSASFVGDQVVFTWRAITDNGGATISGYQLQLKKDDSWENQGNPTVEPSISIQQGLPGEIGIYRVVAVNEIGTSTGGLERTITMPFKPASAPTNFEHSIDAGQLRFSWQAPEISGGSPVTSYLISASLDGISYRSIATLRASSLSTVINLPIRGISQKYRIQAVTSRFGAGQPSDPIDVLVPSIAPNDPGTLTARLIAGEGIELNWSVPSYDGGSPITGYRVELRNPGGWFALGETKETTFLAPLGRAGENVIHRVVALNEIGSSSGARSVLTRMGLAPATPPQGLSFVEVAGRLQLKWLAPENMGGSLSYYEVQQVIGDTTRRISSSRSQIVSLQKPSPGQSISLRVVAYTNAGQGAWSEVVTFDSPKTAPAAPSSFTVRASGNTNTVTWRISGVSDGGAEIQSAILYQEQGTDWIEVARAGAGAEKLDFTHQQFGTTHRYVLRFENAVGESGNSRVLTVRHGVIPTAPASNLSLVTEGTRLRLTWDTPAFTGGSAPSYVDIESSTDGQSWRRVAYTRYSNSFLVNMPPKGASLSYRVTLRNAAGNSQPSEPVSYLNPRTAPSASFAVSAFRSGSNVAFRVAAPTDFGGYEALSLRIELQGTLAWQSSDEYVLSRPGLSSTYLLPLPTVRGTHVYRVVITNPSGEVEKSVSFRY